MSIPRAKKRYGQNFLTDPNILAKITAAAALGPEDFVIEIGPGTGILTRELVKSAGRVAAVEIDGDLIPALYEMFKDSDNLELIHADFLKIDLAALIREQKTKQEDLKCVKLVANLPYYITTPIIFTILECAEKIDLAVIMMQKEVADRLRARPGTKDYGALTLSVNYYCKPEIITPVSPGSFSPMPGVDSAVVRLNMFDTPPVSADKALLFRVISAAFATRRKTLVNCLSAAPSLGLSKEKARSAVIECELDENIRGETLSLEMFAELCAFVS